MLGFETCRKTGEKERKERKGNEMKRNKEIIKNETKERINQKEGREKASKIKREVKR